MIVTLVSLEVFMSRQSSSISPKIVLGDMSFEQVKETTDFLSDNWQQQLILYGSSDPDPALEVPG